MKKKIILLLCTALLALTACGGKNSGQETGNSGSADPAQGTEEAGTGESAGQAAYRTDVAASELRDAVAEEMGEDYWPNMALGEEEVEGLLGLKADAYAEAVVEMPMISANVDTLIVIKGEDGHVEAVEKAVADYREKLIGDTMQYPMNLGKIQASKIEVYGNYVCFVQLGGDTMEASEESEEAVIRQCEEANNKALAVIEKKLTAE